MIHRYVQSEEEYMGYTLKIIMSDISGKMRYHRSCYVFKNGVQVAIGKTKKEIKELIKEGYDKLWTSSAEQ